MSEHDHDPERALDQLLAKAEAPPTIDPAARARILGRLREAVAAPASADADAGADAIHAAGADAGALPSATRGDRTRASSSRGEPEAERQPLPLRRRRWSPLGLGLALAACLALLWAGSRVLEERRRAPAEAEVIASHRNDGDRPTTVALSDGSLLWLRPGAALDELGRRQLRLIEGEAVIQVAADRTPFTVVTPHGSATARGEVLLRGEAASTLVAVIRGHAEVDEPGGRASLRAGEQATFSGPGAPEIAVAPRLTHLLAWARPLIERGGPAPGAVRRGNLLARDPWWAGEWPMPIRRLDVDVVIDGGVARTTIDQTFFNPSLRTLEGVYTFPLPADAAISRMAMYVDGKLQEAGIVERQEGRQIYESIVYQRRDPALLEQMQGNELRLRIFPLPARQEKRIFLSYTQPLAGLYGDQSLRVPIPEVDAPVAEVNVRVRVAGGGSWTITSASHPLALSSEGDDRLARWRGEDVVIGDDLLLQLKPEVAPAPVDAARDGDRWLLRARPELGAASRPRPRRWIILYDTSASRDVGELAAQERLLVHLLRAIDGEDRFTVIAFDTTLRELGELRPVGQVDPEVVRAFARAQGSAHVGATDLAAALERASAIATDPPMNDEEAVILYLGDGLADGPEHDARRLLPALEGAASFVAVGLGEPVDEARLRALADASGGAVALIDAGEDLAWRARDLIATLATPRVVGLEATLLGADGAPLAGAAVDLASTSLADGEDLLLTATSAAAPAAIELRGTLEGQPFQQRLKIAAVREDAGQVAPIWAKARVAALLRDDPEAHKAEITALGLEHFLVTPFTSLLVLEDEAMARRFHLRLPKKDGWAAYEAPAAIPVVVEPLDQLGAPRRGTFVHRRAPELLEHGPGSYAEESGWWGLREGDVIGFGGFGGRGNLGLRGFGRGGGGSLNGLSFATAIPDGSVGLSSLALAGEDAEAAGASDISTGASLHAEPTRWTRAGEARERRSSGRAHQRQQAFGLVGGVITRGWAGSWPVVAPMQPWPRAWSYTGDPRLDDLSALVPALFEDELDGARERLLAASARGRDRAAALPPRARELLTRAREVAPTGVFQPRLANEAIEVGAGGRLRQARTIAGYLREEVVFDGRDLTAVYADLDLAVRRDLAGAAALLYDRLAPWLLDTPEAIAALYDVEVIDESHLRLRLPGAAPTSELAASIELGFDEEGRLATITRRRGDAVLSSRVIVYRGADVEIRERDRDELYRRLGDAAQPFAPATSVVVDVPYASQEELREAHEAAAPGTPARRRALHQRLAALRALERPAEPALVAELLQAGPPTRGELVLASSGVRGLSPALWKTLAKGLDRRDPVAAYVLAIRAGGRAFRELARAHEGTLPGFLASYRALLAEAERPRLGKEAAADLKRFVEEHGVDHPTLAYIATWRIAQAFGWRQPADAAAAWLTLADEVPAWRSVALHAAGTARYQHGDGAAAADVFVRLFERFDDESPPVVDWTVRQAIERQRGEATWHLLWGRWRGEVEERSDPAQLLAFVNAALRLGDGDALHRVLARASLTKVDLPTGLAIVESLLAANMAAEVRPILRHLRSLAPDDPDVLLVSSEVAEALGDLTQAATSLERAIESPKIDDLAELRRLYRHAFQLRARLSQASAEPKATGQALDAALAIAARWRREDPDNPEIDELTADLLFAQERPEEAWRHLSSIVERHPDEGSAHARVAERLAREGDLKGAERSISQAIAAEPTDPTWLLRRAQHRVAADDIEGAQRDLKAIAAGKWQDRFASVTYEAKGLREHLATLARD